MPWWDYWRRPYSTYKEYEFLRDNLQNAEGITIFAFNSVTPKYKNNSSSDITLLGVAYTHDGVYNDFPDLEGRYFTLEECQGGRNVAIIGNRTRREVFGKLDPIGRQLKIKGQKFTVIGVVPEQGAGLLGETSKDENIWIPSKSFSKINYIGTGSGRGIEQYIPLNGIERALGLVKC